MEEAMRQAVLPDMPLQRKRRRLEKPELPFLALLTFLPMQNFLAQLSQQQRQEFLNSLLSLVRSQMQKQREKPEGSASPLLSSVPVLAQGKKMDAKFQPPCNPEEKKGLLSGWQVQPVQMKAASQPVATQEQLPAGSAAQPAAPSTAAPPAAIAGAAKTGAAAQAKERLSYEVTDYARGDEKKAEEVVQEFGARLRRDGWKADDLMAVLLLVIEDNAWGRKGEPELGSASGAGSAMKVVPQKLRQTAQESSHARLASVREMLRYYFIRHPSDYPSVLASALGLAADQEDDIIYLQERLAFELASIGSFALAQRVLAELKRKKKLDKDTRDCLLRLGFYYDPKTRRLVLGKRTCGKPAEAKGIAAMLLGKLVGKDS